MHGFLRSASLLAACVLAAALLIMPYAMWHEGSGGPVGLAIAAAICLLSGWIAEAIVTALGRTTPLGATLIGMMVRMMLPLGVCVAILASGQTGRQHLAFVLYLLAFYMITLTLETCLAVKRAGAPATTKKKVTR
jgi:hypothetical protein